MKSLCLVFLIALSYSTSAQSNLFSNNSTLSGGSPSGSTGGSYFDMSLGSGLTIPVNLWGFVRNPGRYVVGSSTTLIQLISYGGGPQDQALLTEVKIVRDVTVDSTIKQNVIVINLEEYTKTGDPSKNPILYPGDTVILPGTAVSTFQNTLGMFRDVALVLQVVLSGYLIARGR